MSNHVAAAVLSPLVPEKKKSRRAPPTLNTDNVDDDLCEVSTPGGRLRQARGCYTGVVSCIGTEPQICIPEIGEFRFAYRNVMRQPGEGRPIVNVGDEVFCKLTKSDPPKAVHVQLRKGKASAPKAPSERDAMQLPSPHASDALGTTTSFSSRDSVGDVSPSSEAGRVPPRTPFAYDPYSPNGIRYVNLPPTPSSSSAAVPVEGVSHVM